MEWTCVHTCVNLRARAAKVGGVECSDLCTGGPTPDSSLSEDSPHSWRSGLTWLCSGVPHPLAAAD